MAKLSRKTILWQLCPHCTGACRVSTVASASLVDRLYRGFDRAAREQTWALALSGGGAGLGKFVSVIVGSIAKTTDRTQTWVGVV